ncbi:hypothetical protein B0A80_01770 [Flavobacterium tructae]|nr:hypothetical protein B0A80_01770 [Flavobacterium tructae]
MTHKTCFEIMVTPLFYFIKSKHSLFFSVGRQKRVIISFLQETKAKNHLSPRKIKITFAPV